MWLELFITKSKVSDNKEVVDNNGSVHTEDNSVLRKFREKLNIK